MLMFAHPRQSFHSVHIPILTLIASLPLAQCAAAIALIPGLSFAPPAVFCTGAGSPAECPTNANAVAIADVTGTTTGSVPDGWQDVAVCSPPGVRFFRNTQSWTIPANGLASDGTMFHVVPLGLGGTTYDCEFADMDKDDDLDLVVSVRKISGDPRALIAILFNGDATGQQHTGNGVGDFSGPQEITDLNDSNNFVTVGGLTTGDFNADGYVDVAVGGQSLLIDPRMKVLWRDVPSSSTPWSLIQSFAIEQLGIGWEGNGRVTDVARALVCDNTPLFGRIDLVLSTENDDGFGTSAFITFRNMGPPGATVWQPLLHLSANSGSVAIGKFRPNQPNDVVVVGRPVSAPLPDRLRLHHKLSCEVYQVANPVLAPLGDALGPWSFDVGAILGTDENDVAIACASGTPGSGFENGCVAVRLGNGNGEFLEPPYVFRTEIGTTVGTPKFAQIANMDRAGLNDLVVSNYASGTLAILINTTIVVIGP